MPRFVKTYDPAAQSDVQRLASYGKFDDVRIFAFVRQRLADALCGHVASPTTHKHLGDIAASRPAS